MDLSEFGWLLDRPIRMKTADLEREGRLKHCIFAAQLTRPLVEKLCFIADMIRLLSRTKEGSDKLRMLLSHKRAMLYFTQPSTRTFLSFMAACQILGVTCNEVRDPSVSSEVKKESPMDSIRMFSSYFDFIIMRSKVSNFAECCAYQMNELAGNSMRSVPIINAGAGSDEHPTQALLDMYTIERTFNFDHKDTASKSRYVELIKKYPNLTLGPDNKTFTFCGDLGRGRTVRSLVTVLSQYENIRFFFVSPEEPTLQMDSELRDGLIQKGIEIHEFNSLDATFQGKPILGETDALYMTRIQKEHDTPEIASNYQSLDLSHFKLSMERVHRLKEYAPILHPFPRDSEEVEIPTEIDKDPRAMYFRQARNGMWARAALLLHISDSVDHLNSLYKEFYGVTPEESLVFS
ncbi:MAG: aspartate carbamoyltransferase [Planctomycetota bacterium]|nr:aspartate carbamoyltransferase [Planctomycetota bacterium]